MEGLELPKRVFPCASPAEVRSMLPQGKDVLAFQCRNPIHKAHYELFIRALEAPNVGEGAVCLVHPTCGPTQVRAATAAACVSTLPESPAAFCLHNVPAGMHIASASQLVVLQSTEESLWASVLQTVKLAKYSQSHCIANPDCATEWCFSPKSASVLIRSC